MSEQEEVNDRRIDVRTADTIVRDYVCATCWHGLHQVAHDWRDHTCEVACMKEDCDGKGFVTKHYADTKRAESRFEIQDFLRISGDIVGIPRKKLNKEEREELISNLWNG